MATAGAAEVVVGMEGWGVAVQLKTLVTRERGRGAEVFNIHRIRAAAGNEEEVRTGERWWNTAAKSRNQNRPDPIPTLLSLGVQRPRHNFSH